MYLLLFNRTTLPVFVTYLTAALYVHPLWFYKHQHDKSVRSKLSVACQRWWFQWLFWFVPSVPWYLREEEEHKPDPWRNPIDKITWSCIWSVLYMTPTIILNNPVCGAELVSRYQLGSWRHRLLSDIAWPDSSNKTGWQELTLRNDMT